MARKHSLIMGVRNGGEFWHILVGNCSSCADSVFLIFGHRESPEGNDEEEAEGGNSQQPQRDACGLLATRAADGRGSRQRLYGPARQRRLHPGHACLTRPIIIARLPLSCILFASAATKLGAAPPFCPPTVSCLLTFLLQLYQNPSFPIYCMFQHVYAPSLLQMK